MSLLDASSNRSFRVRCAITLWIMALAAVSALPASAQTGVIAFRDDCAGRLYAMRGDGSARIALPLPQLPEPTGD